MSLKTDIFYLQGAVSLLEKFLLSTELVWRMDARPAPGEGALPSLSLEGVLLACARLRAGVLPMEQQFPAERLVREIEAILQRWQTAVEGKARRTFRTRLNRWKDFLDDYKADPEGNFDRYPYEVRLRVMLELLAERANQLAPAEHSLLAMLDISLQAIYQPGEFIWEAGLERSFPAKPFWYLYGVLPSGSKP